MAPQAFVNQLLSENIPSNLKCKNCETVVGVKDFQKGKHVFRLKKGLIHKKLQKK